MGFPLCLSRMNLLWNNCQDSYIMTLEQINTVLKNKKTCKYNDIINRID